jgi:hypothetical protein
MSRDRPSPPEALVRIPTHYEVGPHTVTVSMSMDWRWSVSVDGGAPLPSTFESQVEAWEAGVREADRRDKLGPA